MPDEEEIKIFKQRSDDIKIADMLLDLLVSNLIFKIFVLKNSDCRDGCKGQCGAVIDEIKKICDNKELNHEWLTLSRLHIFYQLETMEELNPSVKKYLHFETQKLGKDLSEEEIWEQGDNEELIFSFLDTVVSDELFSCAPGEREGYKFEYFKDSTGEIVDLPVKITADCDLTAVYSPCEYNIDYWLNGGSFTVWPQYTFNVESGAVQLPVPDWS